MGDRPVAGAATPPSVKRRREEAKKAPRPSEIGERQGDYDAEHRDELLAKAAKIAERGGFSAADILLINMFVAGRLGCFKYSGHNSDYKEQFRDMWDAAQDPAKLDEIASDPMLHHLCTELKLRHDRIKEIMEPCGIHHTVAILVNDRGEVATMGFRR